MLDSDGPATHQEIFATVAGVDLDSLRIVRNTKRRAAAEHRSEFLGCPRAHRSIDTYLDERTGDEELGVRHALCLPVLLDGDRCLDRQIETVDRCLSLGADREQGASRLDELAQRSNTLLAIDRNTASRDVGPVLERRQSLGQLAKILVLTARPPAESPSSPRHSTA